MSVERATVDAFGPLPHRVAFAGFAVREKPAWGEARFIRFTGFAKNGGGRCGRLSWKTSQPRDRPARYDPAAADLPFARLCEFGMTILPSNWIRHHPATCLPIFGNIDARALIVGCEGWRAAWIDHVYLARSRSDLEFAPCSTTEGLSSSGVFRARASRQLLRG